METRSSGQIVRSSSNQALSDDEVLFTRRTDPTPPDTGRSRSSSTSSRRRLLDGSPAVTPRITPRQSILKHVNKLTIKKVANSVQQIEMQQMAGEHTVTVALKDHTDETRGHELADFIDKRLDRDPIIPKYFQEVMAYCQVFAVAIALTTLVPVVYVGLVAFAGQILFPGGDLMVYSVAGHDMSSMAKPTHGIVVYPDGNSQFGKFRDRSEASLEVATYGEAGAVRIGFTRSDSADVNANLEAALSFGLHSAAAVKANGGTPSEETFTETARISCKEKSDGSLYLTLNTPVRFADSARFEGALVIEGCINLPAEVGDSMVQLCHNSQGNFSILLDSLALMNITRNNEISFYGYFDMGAGLSHGPISAQNLTVSSLSITSLNSTADLWVSAPNGLKSSISFQNNQSEFSYTLAARPLTGASGSGIAIDRTSRTLGTTESVFQGSLAESKFQGNEINIYSDSPISEDAAEFYVGSQSGSVTIRTADNERSARVEMVNGRGTSALTATHTLAFDPLNDTMVLDTAQLTLGNSSNQNGGGGNLIFQVVQRYDQKLINITDSFKELDPVNYPGVLTKTKVYDSVNRGGYLVRGAIWDPSLNQTVNHLRNSLSLKSAEVSVVSTGSQVFQVTSQDPFRVPLFLLETARSDASLQLSSLHTYSFVANMGTFGIHLVDGVTGNSTCPVLTIEPGKNGSLTSQTFGLVASNFTVWGDTNQFTTITAPRASASLALLSPANLSRSSITLQSSLAYKLESSQHHHFAIFSSFDDFGVPIFALEKESDRLVVNGDVLVSGKAVFSGETNLFQKGLIVSTSGRFQFQSSATDSFRFGYSTPLSGQPAIIWSSNFQVEHKLWVADSLVVQRDVIVSGSFISKYMDGSIRVQTTPGTSGTLVSVVPGEVRVEGNFTTAGTADVGQSLNLIGTAQFNDDLVFSSMNSSIVFQQTGSTPVTISRKETLETSANGESTISPSLVVTGDLSIGSAASIVLDLRIDGFLGASLLANPGFTKITVDASSSSVGRSVQVVKLPNSNMFMVYVDKSQNTLKACYCIDVTCSSTKIRTIDAPPPVIGGNVGDFPAMTITKTNRAIVVYAAQAATQSFVRLGVCVDAECSEFNTRNLVTGVSPAYTAIAIGSDGMPLIAYRDLSKNLWILHCTQEECQTNDAPVSVPNAASKEFGLYTNILIGADGLPLILHYIQGSGIQGIHCPTPSCSTVATGGDIDKNVGNYGEHMAATLTTDGMPLVFYAAKVGVQQNILTTKCNDYTCPPDQSVVNYQLVQSPPLSSTQDYYIDLAVTLGTDWTPFLVFHDITTGNVLAGHCSNADCTKLTTNVIDTIEASTRARDTSVTIGPDGNPLIAYYANRALRVLHCGNKFCIPNNF